ncbi:MAG: hypothetical protein J7L66_04640, partial [Anaerolineaceae bacterium]|nr:hypothetical protein [Anaerolineaceae bacterium]
LLDSGLPKKAFKEYLKSLSKYPPIALVDYRRILFSFFSLFIKLDSFREKFIQRRIEGIDILQFEHVFPSKSVKKI